MEKTLSASADEKNSNYKEPEESGWTCYFEDFCKDIETCYCSSTFGGSSLVSDAASCAAWKFSHKNINVKKSPYLSKKLSLKKTRTKQILDDDSLEDTASSPLNSPKVSDMNPREMISRKIDDQLLDGSRDKRFKSEHNPML